MKLLKLYRISNALASGTIKEKLPFADKRYCLENFLKVFGTNDVHLFADNVNDETYNWLLSYKLPLLGSFTDSESQSFRLLLNEALASDPWSYVYFVEDDYLHKQDSEKILLEGLEIADYVSLYDHPDKYVPTDFGGNPDEETKVFLTANKHWKLTNSTTCCFATRVKTLIEDQEIFWDATERTSTTQDYWMFFHLREKGRTVATPIPAMSTHCEIKYLSPLVDWEKI